MNNEQTAANRSESVRKFLGELLAKQNNTINLNKYGEPVAEIKIKYGYADLASKLGAILGAIECV